MSFVRLLSPARASSRPQSPASSSSNQIFKPTLSLHVPGYGGVFATLQEPNALDLSASLEPVYDLDVRGELEIRMPHGSGRMRCKSIRVGLRSELKIDIKGKKKEEHELLDRRVEIIGGSSEGVWLEEGAQRFEFTLILPNKLAPQNWVPGANISHALYAELEGVPEPTTSSPFFRTLSLSSFSSGHKTPASPGSSRLPSRSPSPSRSPLPNESTSMSFTRQESGYIPQAPTYDESQAVYTGKSLQSPSEGDAWITGTHKTQRTIMIIYNPNPTGQVNSLDEQVSGFVEGVGVYKWRMSADEWHIAAWPLFRFILPDPSSNVTLFAFRYSLAQTVMITSPNDPDHPHTVTRNFPFVERGERPPREAGHPGTQWPALWRGRDAGGSDEGEYKIEAKGQMPKDDVLRPSTVPGVSRSTLTPIHIAHTLVAEVFFSIWGKTEFGEDMAKPGPGGLQVMRIKRPVVVPSCALIAQVINLPTYQHTARPSGEKVTSACGPCKLCGSRPHEILCQRCPPTVIPHLRHDLDPTLTGNQSGVCPLCAGKSFVPDGAPTWQICACGLAIDKTEERMKAFLQEMDTEGQESRRRTETTLKEEAERGRRTSRT